ncbi:hypothetical protein ACHAW6_009787 [Cyclotella cf. meneghiniana]
MCLSEHSVKDVIIPAPNKELIGDPLTMSEFYFYRRCHFFMSCFEGIFNQRIGKSLKPISMRDRGPFPLNKFISLRRYNLTNAMHYTDKPPTDFVDQSHDVHQMIDSFNQHHAKEYIPSWLSFHNESDTLLEISIIPFPVEVIKMQERKDHLKDATGKWVFSSKVEGTNATSGCKFSKTSTLMCVMTEQIHGIGKILSMNSSFCVIAGILHLCDCGVYGQSLI